MTPTDPSQQTPPTDNIPPITKLLISINRLAVKAFQAKNQESLKFIILNDTVQVIRYDRAILWGLSGSKPKLLGVSGQSSVKDDTEVAETMTALVRSLKEPDKTQQLSSEVFTKNIKLWEEFKNTNQSAVLWFPIAVDGKLTLGLWMERWQSPKGYEVEPQILDLYDQFLLPIYSSAWEKFQRRFSYRNFKISRLGFYLGLLTIGFLLFTIHLPIRIVAPCEVVPKDPFLMTAPLEGIIAEVNVKPGQIVRKGDLLYVYDTRQPLQDLKVAQKQVQIMEAEVNRASTMGLSDQRSLTELATLYLKLDKEKVRLELAEYHESLLNGISPLNGIVMLDNPDEWRGKPVKVGEKIMKISEIGKTKIEISIAESDNIVLDMGQPIKIYLNIHPEVSYEAKLTYIANESTISDQQIPSFIADADWIKPPENVKLGLKGTAILYGENVSLFYFLLRKPIAYFRHLIGI